jgi:hypothetical protein
MIQRDPRVLFSFVQPGWFFVVLLALCVSPRSSLAAPVPSARLVKVLPHFVDQRGRIALSPSLYERDAYQAQLRKNPSQQGGMRFDVQWKSSSTNRFLLRLELRGNKANVGTTLTLQQSVKYTGFFSTWSRLPITKDAHTALGELSAWRATMWDGERLLAEQKSFLW